MEKVIRYIDDTLSEDERREVYAWICESEQHMREYRQLRHLYDLMLWRSDEQRSAETQSRPKPRRRHLGAWASAVCSVACLTIAVILFHNSRSVEPLATFGSITAPAGSELQVSLTDGTTIWLNSRSTLSMVESSNSHQRRVRLEGEGYFEVAKDPKHPFVVETSQLDVQVLGTEFDLSAYPGDEWSTSLVSGSVAILDKSGEELTRLRPMTKAVYDDSKIVVSSINTDSCLWREGIIYFDNLTLSEILDKLSNYYNLQFDTSSSATCLSHRYTGKFRSVDGYEHILKVLQLDSGLKYCIEPSPGTVTVRIK